MLYLQAQFLWRHFTERGRSSAAQLWSSHNFVSSCCDHEWRRRSSGCRCRYRCRCVGCWRRGGPVFNPICVKHSFRGGDHRIWRGACTPTRSWCAGSVCFGVGNISWRRSCNFLLCGRRRRSRGGECGPSHPKGKGKAGFKGSREGSEARFCSSGGGRDQFPCRAHPDHHGQAGRDPDRAKEVAGCCGRGGISSASSHSSTSIHAPEELCSAGGISPQTKGLALQPPPPKLPSKPASSSQNPAEELQAERGVEGESVLALAMLEQSKALTTLVSQLQGGDPLLDSQAISSPMSSKGAAGREKLQRDLSSRSGSFFLQVMQNAFRRMKPASAMPTSIAEIAATDFSFLQYLERCGGYGNSRDMGLVMYSLAFVADAAIKDDMAGVQEHLALALVAIEQAVQDQNKWGLAFQLTLLEDPPPPMFTYRNYVPQSTGRMRAFAPLCPQRWATVALAYTKEMDYIQSRRTETSKKASPVPQQGPPSPKKRGKFPKAKQQNQGDQQEQDPGVEAVVSTSDLRGCDVREGTLLLPSSSTSVQANGSAICGRRRAPPLTNTLQCLMGAGTLDLAEVPMIMQS